MNFSKRIFYILLSLLFLIGCDNNDDIDNSSLNNEPTGKFIDEWTYKVFSKSTDNFDVAEFRLWLPKNDISAIIVLCHSRNSNGLGLALSSKWQEYAIAKNLGLLAVHFKSSTYTDAAGGSGDALLNALEKITTKHNVPKINELPFLMRGYSAGGTFSYHFSEFKPNRVICFANIRGANGFGFNSSTKNIPGLILTGELESSRVDAIRDLILPERRNLNHLLGFAVEPNTGHYGSLGNSDALVRTFFSAALTQRLSEGTNQLNTITENNGWLGNNITTNFYSFDNYPNKITEASWLLDETFAKHWKAYQTK